MNRWFFVLFLISILFAGCSSNPAASPTGNSGISPSAPSAALTDSPADRGFSIWLYAGALPPAEIDPLDPPPLESNPLITLNEIVSYDRSDHGILLTGEGYEIIRNLAIPTNGLAFAICVDGELIYTGAFWAAYSSQSYDGVVIDPLFATSEEPVIHITLGYPGESFYEDADPRSDARILQALEEAGKLKTD